MRALISQYILQMCTVFRRRDSLMMSEFLGLKQVGQCARLDRHKVEHAQNLMIGQVLDQTRRGALQMPRLDGLSFQAIGAS